MDYGYGCVDKIIGHNQRQPTFKTITTSLVADKTKDTSLISGMRHPQTSSHSFFIFSMCQAAHLSDIKKGMGGHQRVTKLLLRQSPDCWSSRLNFHLRFHLPFCPSVMPLWLGAAGLHWSNSSIHGIHKKVRQTKQCPHDHSSNSDDNPLNHRSIQSHIPPAGSDLRGDRASDS